MARLFLLLLISLLGHGAHAQLGAARPPGAEFEDFLRSLQRLNQNSAPKNCDLVLTGLTDPEPPTGYYTEVPLPKSFRDGDAKCDIFIKPDGTYGPTGETISRLLRDNSYFSVLISDETANLPSIRNTCSYFVSMSKEDRIHLTVWIMASIAWDETKCGERMTNPSNLNATGLFQMEKSEEDRKWRGPYCEGESMKPDPKAADPHIHNALCAMEILRGQYEGFYGKAGLYPDAYFEKLRGSYAGNFSKSEILRRIRQHPACDPQRPKRRPINWSL